MADAAVAERVERIHDHLVATQERPVERSASRWIGEAEAVVGDLVDDAGTLDHDVLSTRLSHVETLLGNVEGTEDDEANEHVEAARSLTGAVLSDLDS